MSKNILYISSFLPADIPYAGNKTSFHIYNHIHKLNNLHAYIFYNEIEEEFLNDFKNYTFFKENTNNIFLQKISNINRIINLILYPFLPIMFSIRLNIFIIFKILFSRTKYDLIYNEWSQTAFLSFLLSRILKIKLIISKQDVLLQNLERKFYNSKNIFLKLFYYFEITKLKYFEPFILSRADFVFVQSKKDLKYIQERFPQFTINVSVINPYVTNNFNFNPSNDLTIFNIIFWGAVNRTENIQAVLHYIDHIHPEITSLIPDYHFYIVGAKPNNKILKLASKNVSVTGFISDPSEIFNKAHISVVPLQTGAGIKVKTLESLIMGLPTIASEIGAEGISVNQDGGLFVYYSNEEFIKLILKIYYEYKNNQIDKRQIRSNVFSDLNFQHSLDHISLIINQV